MMDDVKFEIDAYLKSCRTFNVLFKNRSSGNEFEIGQLARTESEIVDYWKQYESVNAFRDADFVKVLTKFEREK